MISASKFAAVGRGKLATLTRAHGLVRQFLAAGKNATVTLRGRTYYLPETLKLTSEDSGTKAAPVTSHQACYTRRRYLNESFHFANEDICGMRHLFVIAHYLCASRQIPKSTRFFDHRIGECANLFDIDADAVDGERLQFESVFCDGLPKAPPSFSEEFSSPISP